MYLTKDGMRSINSQKNIKTRCIIKHDDKILAVGETICGMNDMFCKNYGRKESQMET
jgi:hypothetical protein